MSTKDNTPALPKLGETGNKVADAANAAPAGETKRYKLLSRIVVGRGESKAAGSLIELTEAQAASKLFASRVEIYVEPKAS